MRCVSIYNELTTLLVEFTVGLTWRTTVVPISLVRMLLLTWSVLAWHLGHLTAMVKLATETTALARNWMDTLLLGLAVHCRSARLALLLCSTTFRRMHLNWRLVIVRLVLRRCSCTGGLGGSGRPMIVPYWVTNWLHVFTTV